MNTIEEYLNNIIICPRCKKLKLRLNYCINLFECSNKKCKARFTVSEITNKI